MIYVRKNLKFKINIRWWARLPGAGGEGTHDEHVVFYAQTKFK